MKFLHRLLYSYLLITICFISGRAQTDFRGQLVLGLNMTQLEGDRIKGFNQAGLLAGVALEIPLIDKITIQPEMRFSQKGSRNGEDESYLIIRTNYLEMPVSLNYYVLPELYLQAGVTFNYLINAKTDNGLGFDDGTDAFNRWESCTNIGAGYVLSDRWVVSTNWMYSIANVSKLESLWSNHFTFSIRYFLKGKEE